MEYFVESHLEACPGMPNNGIHRTPLGLSYFTPWGSLRHAAGHAAILAHYSRSVRAGGDAKRADAILEHAERQVCACSRQIVPTHVHSWVTTAGNCDTFMLRSLKCTATFVCVCRLRTFWAPPTATLS